MQRHHNQKPEDSPIPFGHAAVVNPRIHNTYVPPVTSSAISLHPSYPARNAQQYPVPATSYQRQPSRPELAGDASSLFGASKNQGNVSDPFATASGYRAQAQTAAHYGQHASRASLSHGPPAVASDSNSLNVNGTSFFDQFGLATDNPVTSPTSTRNNKLLDAFDLNVSQHHSSASTAKFAVTRVQSTATAAPKTLEISGQSNFIPKKANASAASTNLQQTKNVKVNGQSEHAPTTHTHVASPFNKWTDPEGSAFTLDRSTHAGSAKKEVKDPAGQESEVPAHVSGSVEQQRVSKDVQHVQDPEARGPTAGEAVQMKPRLHETAQARFTLTFGKSSQGTNLAQVPLQLSGYGRAHDEVTAVIPSVTESASSIIGATSVQPVPELPPFSSIENCATSEGTFSRDLSSSGHNPLEENATAILPEFDAQPVDHEKMAKFEDVDTSSRKYGMFNYASDAVKSGPGIHECNQHARPTENQLDDLDDLVLGTVAAKPNDEATPKPKPGHLDDLSAPADLVHPNILSGIPSHLSGPQTAGFDWNSLYAQIDTSNAGEARECAYGSLPVGSAELDIRPGNIDHNSWNVNGEMYGLDESHWSNVNAHQNVISAHEIPEAANRAGEHELQSHDDMPLSSLVCRDEDHGGQYNNEQYSNAFSTQQAPEDGNNVLPTVDGQGIRELNSPQLNEPSGTENRETIDHLAGGQIVGAFDYVADTDGAAHHDSSQQDYSSRATFEYAHNNQSSADQAAYQEPYGGFSQSTDTAHAQYKTSEWHNIPTSYSAPSQSPYKSLMNGNPQVESQMSKSDSDQSLPQPMSPDFDQRSSISISSSVSSRFEYILCPKCTKRNDVENSFCGKCGTRITGLPTSSASHLREGVNQAFRHYGTDIPGRLPTPGGRASVPPVPDGGIPTIEGNRPPSVPPMASVGQASANMYRNRAPRRTNTPGYAHSGPTGNTVAHHESFQDASVGGSQHAIGYYTPYVAEQAPSEALVFEDPLGRHRGHCIATFGFGGRLFITHPKRQTRYVMDGQGRPSVVEKTYPGSIRVISSHNLVDQATVEGLTTSSMGPLVGGKSKAKKKDVVKLVEEFINTTEHERDTVIQMLAASTRDGAMTTDEGRAIVGNKEDEILVVKLLKLLLENDGASLALGGAKADIISQQVQALLGVAPPDTSGALDLMQAALLGGDRERACKIAVEANLWAHALIIASNISKERYGDVVLHFSRKEFGGIEREGSALSIAGNAGENVALKVVFGLFGGLGPNILDEYLPETSGRQAIVAPESLGKWREVLCMILANRTPGDLNTIAILGDRLRACGKRSAAEFCYMLASLPNTVGGIDTPQVRIVLLGADHNRHPESFFRSRSALQKTEIYEYSHTLISNAGLSNTFPYLQAYKLHQASLFADLGLHDEAIKYCESIEAIVKTYSRGSPYFHRTFTESLRNMADMLAAYKSGATGHVLAKEGGGGWLSKLGSLGARGVEKFMNNALGDTDNTAAAAATAGTPTIETGRRTPGPASAPLYGGSPVPDIPSARPASTPVISGAPIAHENGQRIDEPQLSHLPAVPTVVFESSFYHQMGEQYSVGPQEYSSGESTQGIGQAGYQSQNITHQSYAEYPEEGEAWGGEYHGYQQQQLGASDEAVRANAVSQTGHETGQGPSGDQTYVQPQWQYQQYGNFEQGSGQDPYGASANGEVGAQLAHSYDQYGYPGGDAGTHQEFTENGSGYAGYGYPQGDAGTHEEFTEIGSGYAGYGYLQADAGTQELTENGSGYTEYGYPQENAESHQELAQNGSEYIGYEHPQGVAGTHQEASQNASGYAGYYDSPQGGYKIDDNAPVTGTGQGSPWGAPSFVEAVQQDRDEQISNTKIAEGMEDNDDPLGLGNKAAQKAKEKDQEGTNAPTNPSSESPKEDNTAKPDAAKSKSLFSAIGSLFAGRRRGSDENASSKDNGSGPVKANLGEKNSFYYDEKKKRWINKNADTNEEETKELPPPPMGISASAPVSRMGTPGVTFPPSAPNTADGSPSNSASQSPALAGGMGTKRAGARRGARNRYVDVFNPDNNKSSAPTPMDFIPTAAHGADGFSVAPLKIMKPMSPAQHGQSSYAQHERASQQMAHPQPQPKENVPPQTQRTNSSHMYKPPQAPVNNAGAVPQPPPGAIYKNTNHVGVAQQGDVGRTRTTSPAFSGSSSRRGSELDRRMGAMSPKTGHGGMTQKQGAPPSDF